MPFHGGRGEEFKTGIQGTKSKSPSKNESRMMLSAWMGLGDTSHAPHKSNWSSSCTSSSSSASASDLPSSSSAAAAAAAARALRGLAALVEARGLRAAEPPFDLRVRAAGLLPCQSHSQHNIITKVHSIEGRERSTLTVSAFLGRPRGFFDSSSGSSSLTSMPPSCSASDSASLCV